MPRRPGSLNPTYAEVEEVVYNGVVYRRYPSADRESDRNYFQATGSQGLHRQVWEDNNGPIPPGFHVHHKDGNTLNNSPDNLECVDSETHGSKHTSDTWSEARKERHLKNSLDALEKAKLWHASEEGRAWHREHARKAWKPRGVQRYCACGNSFIDNSARGIGKYCSKQCQKLAIYQPVECPVCHKSFLNHPTQPRKTCSFRCGAINRRRTGLIG